MISSIRKVIHTIIELIEIKIEQIMFKIVVRATQTVSTIIGISLLGIFSLFFLFFLSFALVEMINIGHDKKYLGFFIISGAYLLVIILVFFLIKSGKLLKWTEAIIIKLKEARNAKKKSD